MEGNDYEVTSERVNFENSTSVPANETNAYVAQGSPNSAYGSTNAYNSAYAPSYKNDGQAVAKMGQVYSMLPVWMVYLTFGAFMMMLLVSIIYLMKKGIYFASFTNSLLYNVDFFVWCK